MIEQHVGKKRLKEVRQAIFLQDAMKKTLISSFAILVIGAIIICSLYLLNYHKGFIPDEHAFYVRIALIFVTALLAAMKASKYVTLRGVYKDHLVRYNISKDDISSLEVED